MAEYLFVNSTYVKKFTQLTSAVDEDLLEPTVLIAQDLHVKPRLGDNLWRKLKTDAAAGTLTGLYETLVEDYLRKCVVWWTMVELFDKLYVRWDNGAPQIRISDETNQIEYSDLKRQIDAARRYAQNYTDDMVNWLCVYGSQISEYNSNTAPDRPPTHDEVFNQSGLTFSKGARSHERQLPKWAWKTSST